MENKKKKIIYCITKGNWGGAQKYVYDLVVSLPADKYDVAVLLGANGALADKLEAVGIRTLILGNMFRDISYLKDLRAFWRLLQILRREKPDIIHLNSSKMGLFGGLIGRLLNIPQIIFTGHGWAFNEDRSSWQKKTIFWLHKLTIALSHKTIAVSEQTKAQIQGGKFLNNKMVVIRNGIGNIEFFDREVARDKLLNKINQGFTLIDLKDKKWIGTISELHKNKGLKYLIEAIHLLSLDSDDRADLPLVFIIGAGEKKEKLQARINRYGLQSNIFMVGRVEEAEKYVKAFDIFTLTSITEALPYVLLEAGQAGLPIIASGVGGIPEIINDMESGVLVRSKEPEEIKRAIEFLLKNPEKAKLFGQTLQQKICKHFNKDTMVRKTVELYNK